MHMAQANEVRIPVKLVNAATGEDLPIQGLELVSTAYMDRVAVLLKAAREISERDAEARKSGFALNGMERQLDSLREALKAVDLPQKVALG